MNLIQKGIAFVQKGFHAVKKGAAQLALAAGVGIGTAAGTMPMPASATMSADVTSAVATFADVNSAIPVVGGAFLLALGILAAWKLVRGAFA